MDTIAEFSVILGIISSLIIALDLIKNKQAMPIMESVWVLTALWSSVIGLVAYFSFGRQKKMMNNDEHTPSTMKMDMDNRMAGMDMKKMARPRWQSVSLSTLHCGAGCTLADLIGEWMVFFLSISILGSAFLTSVVVDYILALCIGIYFQYAAIRSMLSISREKAILKAAKADIFSLSAWQIGMYGFMAIALFILFPNGSLERNSWAFWFMMQIAMFFGFLFSYPVNVLLIKRGVKSGM